MNREHFDALTRFVSTTSSRRGALAALLGAAFLHQGPGLDDTEARRRRKRKRKAKRRRRRLKRRTHVVFIPVLPPPPPPQPACFTGKNCNFPGPGVVSENCNFSGSTTFVDLDVQGAILNGANFTDADASGTNFHGVLLKGACFVGADLFGATIDESTLLEGAIFCNTTMPDGSLNNTGCNQGTACCPAA
jgi:hypothetical protein